MTQFQNEPQGTQQQPNWTKWLEIKEEIREFAINKNISDLFESDVNFSVV